MREFERIAYETALSSWRAKRSGAYSDTRGSAGSTTGINYTLQMATNLAAPDWTSLITNSPAKGTFTFTDPGATHRSRCYRAVKQQGGEQNTLSEIQERPSMITQRNL